MSKLFVPIFETQNGAVSGAATGVFGQDRQALNFFGLAQAQRRDLPLRAQLHPGLAAARREPSGAAFYAKGATEQLRSHPAQRKARLGEVDHALRLF